MKTLITKITICILFLSAYTYAQTASIVYQKTVNSVVTIETDNALGSGFFIGNNLVATNYHVIDGASSAIIILNSTSQTYKVEGYVAKDETNDLVILKVSYLKGMPLKFATKNVKQGDDILAIGSPKGIPATISKGIVSNLNSEIKLIQIDASISHGSSGGPVLNMNGEVIGVAVGTIEKGQNLNFAIPIGILENLLNFNNRYAIKLNNQNLDNDLSANETKVKSNEVSSNENRVKATIGFRDKQIKDIDGNVYNTVKIGSQIWMAENLSTTSYNDGTPIKLDGVLSDEMGHYCWYENNIAYKTKYGALYDWEAVKTDKLCPVGWHIPKVNEWEILKYSLGNDSNVGIKLKATDYPRDYVAEWTKGSNESGFTAVPSGNATSGDYKPKFSLLGTNSFWWSSSIVDKHIGYAWDVSLNNCFSMMTIWRAEMSYSLLSVRCIKD